MSWSKVCLIVLASLWRRCDPQPLSRASSAGSFDLACTSPPTVLSSCSPRLHSNDLRSSALVLQNLIDKPLLLEWLDGNSEAVPKYIIPADCAIWIPTFLGDAYRARAALVPGGARIAPCKVPLSRPLRPNILVPQLAEPVNVSSRTGPAWTALGGGMFPDIVLEFAVLTTTQKAHVASFAYSRGHASMCAELAVAGHAGSMPVQPITIDGDGRLKGPVTGGYDASDEVEIALLPDGHTACAPSAGHWLPPNRPMAMQWPPTVAAPPPLVYGPTVPVSLPPEPTPEPPANAPQSMFRGGAPAVPKVESLPFELELTHHDVRVLGTSTSRPSSTTPTANTGTGEEEGEDDPANEEAFRDFLRSLDGLGEELGRGPRLEGRIRRTSRATFSLSHGKVVGSNPTESHEGVTVTATAMLADFAQPRPMGASFLRPMPCKHCNYPLQPESNGTDSTVEGVGANGTAGTRVHAHGDMDPTQLVPLVVCPRCLGEGIISLTADVPPAIVGTAGYTHATQSTRTHCPVCGGVGTLHAKGHACALCGGRRFIREPAEFATLVPAGVPDGWTDVQEGKGGSIPFRTPGPIRTILAVEEQPSDPRKRQAVQAELTAVSAFSVASLHPHKQRLSNYTRLATLPAYLSRLAGAGTWAGDAAGGISAALAVLSSLPLDPSSPTSVSPLGPHVAAAMSLSLEAAVAGFRLRIRPPSTRKAQKAETALEGEAEQAWREALEAETAASAARAAGPWGGLDHGPGDILEISTDSEAVDEVWGGGRGGERDRVEASGLSVEAESEHEREPDEIIDLDAPEGAQSQVRAPAHVTPAAPPHNGTAQMRSTQRKTGGNVNDTGSSPPKSFVDEEFGSRPWMLDMRGQPVLPGDLLVLPGAGLPLFLPGECEWVVPCPTLDRDACGLAVPDFDSNCSSLAPAWRVSFQAYMDECAALPPMKPRRQGSNSNSNSYTAPNLPWRRLASVPMRELHARLGWLADRAIPVPDSLNGTIESAGAGNGTTAREEWQASNVRTVPERPSLGVLHVMCPAIEHSGATLPWPGSGSAIRMFPHGAAVFVPQVDSGLGLALGFESGRGGGWEDEDASGTGEEGAREGGADRSGDTAGGNGVPAQPMSMLPSRNALSSLRSLVRSAVALMGPDLLPAHAGSQSMRRR